MTGIIFMGGNGKPPPTKSAQARATLEKVVPLSRYDTSCMFMLIGLFHRYGAFTMSVGDTNFRIPLEDGSEAPYSPRGVWEVKMTADDHFFIGDKKYVFPNMPTYPDKNYAFGQHMSGVTDIPFTGGADLYALEAERGSFYFDEEEHRALSIVTEDMEPRYHYNSPAERLKLIQSKNYLHRMTVAKYTKVLDELVALLQDDAPVVRAQAAQNDNTPLALVKKATRDKHPVVRFAARREIKARKEHDKWLEDKKTAEAAAT